MKTTLAACWVLTFALALAVVGSAAADGYVVAGQADGYLLYQGDPYYWKGNQAYTRQLYQQPAYYSYGYYYPAKSYYQYSYSHTYVPPKVTESPGYGPGWQDRLLKIAETRDKYVAKAALAQQDHNHYLEAVQALGFQGNFRWDGYGMPLGFTNYGGYSAYKQQAAAVGAYGNTQYGYSVKEVSELYGDTNVNQLYQQAARLAQSAQQLGGQATADFSSLVGQEGSNKARVAEVLARGAAAVSVLKATEPQGSAKFTKQEFRFGQERTAATGPVVIQAPPPADADGPPPAPANGRAALNALIQTKCLSCHNAKTPAADLDLAGYFGFSPRTRAAVIGRVTSDKPEVRMPLGKGSEPGAPVPGVPLTEAELSLFFQ